MPGFSMPQIGGVIPAMITPFTPTEELDEARLRTCTRFLLDRGVGGLYLTGSTGEAFLMAPDERKRVVEVVMDEVAGRVPVIAHVGAIGTRLSIDLARHAEAAGVDALSTVPPFYWQFSADQVYGYYADVVAATGLPMIAYNIALAGIMGFDTIRRIAAIDRVQGIKYTAPTHFDILRIKEEMGPGFRVFSGADEMAMSGFSFGADGIIGSFYNLFPELFTRIRDAVCAGRVEEARVCQKVANTVIFFALERNMLALIKRGMSWQGADAGYCRRPFGNYFDAGAEAALRAELKALCVARNLSGARLFEVL